MKFKYRRYYLYYLGRVIAFKFSIIPLCVGRYIVELFARIAFFALPKYRKTALSNLKVAFGNTRTDKELEAIAKRAFINLGKNAVELVNFPKINKDNLERVVRVKNIEIVDDALAKGKGVIIITGHFGNWELLALTLKLRGYHGCVVGRRIYFEKYDKFLNSLRGYHGIEVVYRDESPKKVLKALRDNGIVGILADQDVDSVDGVFVDFFGRPAYTPKGPVLLAKVSGAALIPAFIVREDGHHTLVIEKPIELADTGDKDKDVVTNTERWSRVVEAYIRKYPEQWVWMHKRWKTKK